MSWADFDLTHIFEQIWNDFQKYIPEDFEPNSAFSDLNAQCTLTAINPKDKKSNILNYRSNFPTVDIALDAEKYFKYKMYGNEGKQDGSKRI